MTSRLTSTILVLALGLLAGCISGNDDESGSGGEASSSTHWLECQSDADCASVAGTCGTIGFCVDTAGSPIEVPGPAPGTPGGDPVEPPAGGSGGMPGTSGSGGSTGGDGDGGGGTYEPCAGKACGDSCTLCAPGDASCVETAEVKSCDDAGNCSGLPAACGPVSGGVVYPDCSGGETSGSTCAGLDSDPVPECCGADGTHLRCEFDVCTNSFPGMCSGTYSAVAGSDACGGGSSGGYDPCAGKGCGDSCTICDPADTGCFETADLKLCDAGGQCQSAAVVSCLAPDPCDPASGTNTCSGGQVCCAVGRCGPVVTDQGQCEPADPSSGGCMPCACEGQPGGCPICNSPDTPILTPDGERPIAELQEGDLVISLHRGEPLAVPVLALRSVRVFEHAVVRLTLDDGRRIEVSGSHPTADGGRLDGLVPGDRLGEREVVGVELVPYEHERTYDILPASDSGTYYAAGALLGSTLQALR